MENENEIVEEKVVVPFDEAVIGTEDEIALKPGSFVVVNYLSEEVENDGKKFNSPKLVIKLDHSSGKEVSVSGLKYLDGEKLKESGLWLSRDSKGCISKKSGVANLLRHYNCNSVKELVGKSVETIVGSRGYLIIKAY